MAREQILDIQDEIRAITDPNPNISGMKSSLMWTDLRPPQTSVEGEGISIGEMKDWAERNTAPNVLRTALEYPFERITSYDKQSMPSGWIGPEGSGGYSSNWRHAGNTALLKNQIANAISPYVGDKIGSTVGGITSFGGGLLHELTALSPIWKDKANISDPFLLDAGQSLRLVPEFKSDMLANLFGSWKGKTGIADTEVLENLLEDISKDDAWSAVFENLIEEEKEERVPRFHDPFFFRTRDQKPWEPEITWFNPFRNEILDKQSWIKKMKERKKYEIPTLRSDTSNIIKKTVTPPPRGGGADVMPITPSAPISVPVPAHIRGGGYEQRGESAQQDRGPPGGDPGWKGSRGGYVDKALGGRSRYL